MIILWLFIDKPRVGTVHNFTKVMTLSIYDHSKYCHNGRFKICVLCYTHNITACRSVFVTIKMHIIIIDVWAI